MIGYGECPKCGVAHPDSIRERRLDGDTRCGHCETSTKSSSWPLYEKYVGFDKLKGKIKGAKNPGAVAASIGRKKYGAEKFQKAAASGKKLKGAPTKEEVNEMIEKVILGDDPREVLDGLRKPS